MRLNQRYSTTVVRWCQLAVFMLMAALLDCTPPALAADQIDSVFHRSKYVNDMRKAGGYSPDGRSVFGLRVLRSIGGVLAQASFEVEQNVAPLLLGRGDCDECIRVRVFGTEAVYDVRYDDIVPMVLFIEGGGTSMYTDWENDAKFRVNAGFVSPERVKGLIALEFRGTKYEMALRFLDFCNTLCLETPPPPEHGRHPYINHDVEREYTFSLTGRDRLSVQGSILRTYWDEEHETSADPQVVIVGEVVLSPINRLAERVASCAQRQKDYCAEKEELQYLGHPLDLFADVYHLYRTLALLRTVKQSTPDAWKGFLEYLTSDIHVAENLSTWTRYTESFCSVYNDQCG